MPPRFRPPAPTPALRVRTSMTTSGRDLGELDRRRGLELLDRIAALRERLDERFYDVALALLELDRRRLWEALGHASFDAMLAAHPVIERSTAVRLVALPDAIPREEAEVLGARKALARVARGLVTPAEKAARRAARETQAELRRRGIRAATVTVQEHEGRWWARVDLLADDLGALARGPARARR